MLTGDRRWYAWSAEALSRAADDAVLVVNPLVYAEISVAFDRVEELDDAVPFEYFRREPLPWDAAFLAGRRFLEYCRRGGQRRSPLPDFYVGAHAAVMGMALLTRDSRRYRTYYPKLRLISPD